MTRVATAAIVLSLAAISAAQAQTKLDHLANADARMLVLSPPTRECCDLWKFTDRASVINGEQLSLRQT